MTTTQMPWEKEYKVFGIPRTLSPYPDEPVFHALDVAANKYKKQGLIQFNYKMTYPELKDNADRLATALADMGLKKGDQELLSQADRHAPSHIDSVYLV